MARSPKDSGEESRRIVQRGEELAFGSRQGDDRRTGTRGLAVGRRFVDQHKARREFIEEIRTMSLEGCSADTIARFLNEEGLRTARDDKWTGSAIEQLLKTEDERREREAWTPPSLDENK